MQSSKSTPVLLLTFAIHVIFISMFFFYLLGFTSKDGLFPFLHRQATFGDIVIIVGLALYMLDDIFAARMDQLEKSIKNNNDTESINQ